MSVILFAPNSLQLNPVFQCHSQPLDGIKYLAITNEETVIFFKGYYNLLWNSAEKLKEAGEINEDISACRQVGSAYSSIHDTNSAHSS